MGIEPTNPDSRHGSAGFEDQARHQTRSASYGIISFVLAGLSELDWFTIDHSVVFRMELLDD